MVSDFKFVGVVTEQQAGNYMAMMHSVNAEPFAIGGSVYPSRSLMFFYLEWSQRPYGNYAVGVGVCEIDTAPDMYNAVDFKSALSGLFYTLLPIA